MLRNDIHALPKNVDKIIKAVVLLHNYLMLQKCFSYCPENYTDNIVNGELVQGQWRNEGNETVLRGLPASRIHNAARESYNLRSRLCRYLYNDTTQV